MTMAFKQFLIEANKKQYEFSSTQFNLPHSLAKKIIDWGNKEIPEEDVCQIEGLGREKEIHVTVLYGLHDDTPANITKLINKLKENKEIKPFPCYLGKMSVFNTKKDFDVLKLEIESPELHRLNRILRNSLEFTSDYPNYEPHATIAYVRKGKGDKFKNDSTFNKQEFIIDNILFSAKDRSKTMIKLN